MVHKDVEKHFSGEFQRKLEQKAKHEQYVDLCS